MPTVATNFMARGMNHVQAGELATQIDGTPDVGKLIRLGFPVPLANELVAQMTAGTGILLNLMALGMPAALAEKVAADITTAGP
jgi:hypothetical protein